MYKAVYKKQYDNGFKLLVQQLPQVASVSVGLQINMGSRYEQDHEAGLCHLIEHMMFQGTSKRSVQSLARIVAVVGGQLDACTGRETTVVYSKVPAEHVSLAVDVIADMLFNSTIAARNLRKEKAVINEEISMVDDTPDELIHDLFIQALWPNQAIGRSILGSKESLTKFTSKKIKSFMSRYYHPGQMTLSLAGNITIEQSHQLVTRWFKKDSHIKSSLIPKPLIASPAHSIWKKSSIEQVHLCLGVSAFPYADPRRLSLIALSTILGGGTNSRLFYAIREQRGLSYNVYSFTDFYLDSGLIGVYAACHPKNFEETISVIKKQIDKVVKYGVTAKELHDVKEQLKGNLKLSLETTSSHMWNMLYHETYQNKHPTIAQHIKEIDQLTKNDLQQAAKDCFKGQDLSSVVIGPYIKKIKI